MSYNPEVLVSIGLPVFNGERYLEYALESLLGQSHTNIELIISDNASTDGTDRIISKYAAKDDRVRIFRQSSNIGAPDNYIFALAQARGPYFMWAAHDDVWDRDWVRNLLAEIKPDDVGVRGALWLFDESGILKKQKLRDFPREGCVRYFLADESTYKTHYIYALFYTEKLRRAEVSALADPYCPDCFYVYSLLQQGSFRSSTTTHIRSRVHPGNLGRAYSQQWKGWRKMLYRIHPLRYYLTYPRYTENSLSRFLIRCLIPVKHLYAQAFFWFRGARELLFRRKFY